MSEDNKEPQDNNDIQVPLEAVQAFIGKNKNEASAEEDSEEKKKRVDVPEDTTFKEDGVTAADIMKSNIPENVTVTEMDKTLYLKAILNDEDVRLDISLLDGKFTTSFKSRSAYEQQCVFKAVSDDEANDEINSHQELLSALQKYCMVIMLEKINSKVFDPVKLTPDNSIEENIQKLRTAVNERINNIPLPKWTLLRNAINIFDTKLYLLAENCANKDFWNPPS